ncbi:hypothetical protein, partial [Methanothrix soehngenii]|uniref:hypothetical protein n=1 Tax=Methanothrix soehngenii TaxID=2223 RepID=UPI002FE4116E
GTGYAGTRDLWGTGYAGTRDLWGTGYAGTGNLWGTGYFNVTVYRLMDAAIWPTVILRAGIFIIAISTL